MTFFKVALLIGIIGVAWASDDRENYLEAPIIKESHSRDDSSEELFQKYYDIASQSIEDYQQSGITPHSDELLNKKRHKALTDVNILVNTFKFDDHFICPENFQIIARLYSLLGQQEKSNEYLELANHPEKIKELLGSLPEDLTKKIISYATISDIEALRQSSKICLLPHKTVIFTSI